MSNKNSDLKDLGESVRAFAVFAAIALGAVAAVDVLLTGGLDLGTGRARHEVRDTYVRTEHTAESLGVPPLPRREEIPAAMVETVVAENLEGGADAPIHSEPVEPGEPDVAPPPEEVVAPPEDTAPVEDEPILEPAPEAPAPEAVGEDELNAYGSASPW